MTTKEELEALFRGTSPKKTISTTISTAWAEMAKKHGFKLSDCLEYGIRQRLMRSNIMEDVERQSIKIKQLERALFSSETRIHQLEKSRSLLLDKVKKA